MKNSPLNKLELETSALESQLGDKVEKRKQTLDKKLPQRLRNKIRLAEKDLKLVLHQGTNMVEKFYIAHVMPKLNSQETSHFWSTRNLKSEDWLGLTSYLFSDLFSPEFMIPLQEIDSTFQLKVSEFPNITIELLKTNNDISGRTFNWKCQVKTPLV